MPRTKTTATRTRRTRTAKVPTMATGIGASLKSLLADHNRQIKQLTRERDRATKALEAIGKDLEKLIAKAPMSNGNGTAKEPRQRKPRGKITDPEQLEKRRAALAKARKARAAKRKAAKQAATATA